MGIQAVGNITVCFQEGSNQKTLICPPGNSETGAGSIRRAQEDRRIIQEIRDQQIADEWIWSCNHD